MTSRISLRTHVFGRFGFNSCTVERNDLVGWCSATVGFNKKPVLRQLSCSHRRVLIDRPISSLFTALGYCSLRDLMTVLSWCLPRTLPVRLVTEIIYGRKSTDFVISLFWVRNTQTLTLGLHTCFILVHIWENSGDG